MADKKLRSDGREELSDEKKIKGCVARVIYSNDENAYAVCVVSRKGKKAAVVNGIMPYVTEGDNILVTGGWVNNPRYGLQFRVDTYEKVMPKKNDDILRYLSSGAIKGIGPVLAARIVEKFGKDTFDVIENRPEELASVKGLTKKTAIAASREIKEKSGMREAMTFFREYFGPALIVKIYKEYGDKAVETARTTPYRFYLEIPGIGFEKVDAMASKLGISPQDKDRPECALIFILEKAYFRNGHTCYPSDDLVDETALYLKCGVDPLFEALEGLKSRGLVKAETMADVEYIYLEYVYASEAYIADKLSLLEASCPSVGVENINVLIEKEEKKNKIQYAEMQKEAIRSSLENGVFILTGGPGTGKTTIVKALIDIFASLGLGVALAAPTGRAAKRMSEATLKEAKTVHRLLEMDYSGEDDEERIQSDFRRNENNPLDESVVIIDEASMMDNFLTAGLLRAMKPRSRLIMVGDADQLPSVGAGNVLSDLIYSERFSTVRLNEIFRQAQKSLIVTNAHDINAGKMPVLNVSDNDFFYLPVFSDEKIAETVVDLCKKRLPAGYGEKIAEEIQVITPSKKGMPGTEKLNALLQDALNPKSSRKREFKHNFKTYRVGDKVMQIRNNYELNWTKEDGSDGTGIFNGDIGVITDINRADGVFTIRFDDRTVEYDIKLLEDLEHAYAITVHKSQGSEYPVVILPAYGAYSMLLTRNLLYTAITRAERMVIIVGSDQIIAKMVSNNRTAKRYTGLRYRLAKSEGQKQKTE